MLTVLSTTPNWWDTADYVCLREVSTDTNKDIDLDVLQAGINLSHRDKFLRDQASRRVAMKRLYQRHPMDTLCQERVSKCNGVMGATFILFLILYRICSKRSQAQADRIKICDRAGVVCAVKADKADRAQLKDSTVTKSSNASDKACKEGGCISKDHTEDPSNYENSYSLKYMASPSPTQAVGAFDGGGNVRCLRAVICQRLLMSGDVELNPGPLDGMTEH